MFFLQILTKLFGNSAFNLRLAVAKKSLATSYLIQSQWDDEKPVIFWARKAKYTTISAYRIAGQIIAAPNACRLKNKSLILAEMRRTLAWAEESIIIQSIRPVSKTYATRLKSVLQSHKDLIHIYKQSYKAENLIIAETLEDLARIHTHLIQHDKANDDVSQMESHYEILYDLSLLSLDIKKGVFTKEGLLGEKDFRINYRMLGEYHLHRYRDLQDQCEFQMAEEYFKKSIEVSREWMGEYDSRLGVAYACLSNIYFECGLTEEAHEMHDKWVHWRALQDEMILNEQVVSHKHCLMCPNFACKDCYSCICQTRLVVKRLDEYEDFFDIIKQVFYESGTTAGYQPLYEYS